jgi:hypothetical protein|tara:strand:- start:210 stop:437 length:228 start_codon:yes stop_codon:yes gene_type:complete
MANKIKEDKQRLYDLGINTINKVTNCCGGETYHLNLFWNNDYFELDYAEDYKTWCRRCDCETQLVDFDEYYEEVE